MEKGKWYFVNNNGALDDGGNNPGIETFSDTPIRSMVRETIQNSIDERVNKCIPVTVEFSLFKCSNNEIPGMNQLRDVFNECLDSLNELKRSQKHVRDFFKQGLEKMGKEINVLRISDFNTIGLTGAENEDENGHWYSLIKGRGSSNTKTSISSGSFGIGKTAPFACSAFRTIFYASRCDRINPSTYESKNVDSYIGVSYLISHKHQEGSKIYKTIGTGFYSDTTDLKAILRPFDLHGFKRKENGTDIYILGFDYTKGIFEQIKREVVCNFFITIKMGRLVVKLGTETIDANNIGHYVEALDDEFSNIKSYYNLLISEGCQDEDTRVITLDSSEYGKEIKYIDDDDRESSIQDGECKLYLHRGPDLNRKILMTRENGMSLFEENNISSISFTGILRITGKTMNAIFRDMEVPTHDKWTTEHRFGKENCYRRAYKGLKSYIRQKVKDCFGDTNEDTIMAYGMDEFFSDAGEDQGSTKISVLENSVKVSVSKVRATKQKKKKGQDISTAPRNDFYKGIESDGHEGQNDKGNSNNRKGNKSTNKQPRKFTFVPLDRNSLRVIKADINSGIYTIRVKTPAKRKAARIKFTVHAESEAFDLNVVEATLNGHQLLHENNEVEISHVDKGQILQIEVRFPFTGSLIMLEADYYEAK